MLYPLAVVLFAGTLVPVLAVRWLTRDGWIRNDLPVNGGDAALLGISLVVGFCLIALALRGQLRREFWHSLRMFIALFAVSLAEVLVFLSIVFNLTEVVRLAAASAPGDSRGAYRFECAVRPVSFHAFSAMEQLGPGHSAVRRLAFRKPRLCAHTGRLGSRDHRYELCYHRLYPEQCDDARRCADHEGGCP